MRITKKMYQIFGVIIGLLGYASAWLFYDWKLMLIIFLVIWSNNISRNFKNK